MCTITRDGELGKADPLHIFANRPSKMGKGIEIAWGYSLMFRLPSLLSPRSFLPLRILLQGSRGFYVRAYGALLPPHAPDMLTVRIQVIDGTGTFTPSDSQPCRLLTLLRRHYPASTLLRPCPTPAMTVACRDVEAATLACDGSPPIIRTTFPTCRAH